MSGLQLCQKIRTNLQLGLAFLSNGCKTCMKCRGTCQSRAPAVSRQRELSMGSPAQQASSYLSDPENKGKRQKGVNFDTIGSWNNRLDMTISLKKSIEKGRLIPELPLGKQ